MLALVVGRAMMLAVLLKRYVAAAATFGVFFGFQVTNFYFFGCHIL